MDKIISNIGYLNESLDQKKSIPAGTLFLP